MMTLISLAIVVAFGYSAAVTLGLDGMDFWWELATLITIMLLGHWLEMSAVMGAQNALGELAALIPDEAELVVGDGGDETRTVAASELAVGDRAPQGGDYYGGEVAAPVFARVMSDALRLLNVRPELTAAEADTRTPGPTGERG